MDSKTILQSETMINLGWNNTILVNFQTSSEGITSNRSQERHLSFLDGQMKVLRSRSSFWIVRELKIDMILQFDIFITLLELWTPSGVRKVLLDSLKDTMETQRRQSSSWEVRELKFDMMLHHASVVPAVRRLVTTHWTSFVHQEWLKLLVERSMITLSSWR